MAGAFKVIIHAVLLSSGALRAINRQVKENVNNILWSTLKELDIAKPMRGCRGGVNVQRRSPLVSSQAPFSLNSDYVTKAGDFSIECLISNRTVCENVTRGCILDNLVKVKLQKRSPVIQIKQERVSVGYMNARSVRSPTKTMRINDFIEENDLDVLALTETWLDSGDKDNYWCGEITPSGYHLHNVPRENRTGGGVAVVVRSGFTTTQQRVLDYKSFELIELVISSKKDSVRMCVVYRPPSSKKHEFIEQFHDYMDSQVSSSGKLIVLGDFNLHFDKPDDIYANQMRDILYSFSLNQHVHMPTHKLGHTLDLVITRSEDDLDVQNLQNYAPDMFDHTPLTFLIQTWRPRPSRSLLAFIS